MSRPVFIALRSPSFLLTWLMIVFWLPLLLKMAPKHTPHRTRQLQPHATAAPAVTETKTSGGRKRELSLKRGPHKTALAPPLKRERRLSLESLLKQRLVDKAVKSLKLPVTDQELKELHTLGAHKEGEEETESASSSSEFGDARKGGKHRSLRSKPRKKLQNHVNNLMETNSYGQSFLEQHAVTKRVRENYVKQARRSSHLCAGKPNAVQDGPGSGSSPGRPFQSKVFGRGGEPLRGLCLRGPDGPRARVREVWESKDPQSLEVPEVMAKAVPSAEPLGIPLSSLVCNFMEDGRAWTHNESDLQPRTVEHLSTPGITLEAPEAWACWPDPWSDAGVVCCDKPLRDLRRVKDWHQGRQCSPGFDVDSLSRTSSADLSKWPEDGQSLDLRLQPVPLRLSRLLPRSGILDLVPYQARHSGPSIDRAHQHQSQEEVLAAQSPVTRSPDGWQPLGTS